MKPVMTYICVGVVATFFFTSHARAAEQNSQEYSASSELADYCSKYSKNYLESYLDHSDNAKNMSDNDKYTMLGELYTNCVSEKKSELKNDVGYNFDKQMYLY